MLHGYPVAAGAILGFLAIRLWHYKKAPRLTAWLFGLAAGLLTIGVTVWLDCPLADIERRDQRDKTRAISPLRKARDAYL